MNWISFIRRCFFSIVLQPWICQWWDRFFPAKSTGAGGERWAERYLLRQGHWIIERNVRTRFSEIDLVTLDGNTIVFIEVKTRSAGQRGTPLDSVDENKQNRLTRAAASYLHRHDLDRQMARFDVIAVVITSCHHPPQLRYLRNAFDAAEEGFGRNA